VRPFVVERFGIAFGLIPMQHRPDPAEPHYWTVEMHPGNYMSFSAPWDRGKYDT
jgi:hypothetical protein